MSNYHERFILECDELDAKAIHEAIARRQRRRIMPDGDGNMAGRVIAEICRGWMELLDNLPGHDSREEGDEWKHE